MDDTFPILEHLCLSSPAKDADAGLILPSTSLAPHLRCITPLNIGLPLGLPTGLRLLFLHFWHRHTHARELLIAVWLFPSEALHLVARLQSLPRHEELSVCFSTPVSSHSCEWVLTVAVAVWQWNVRNT